MQAGRAPTGTPIRNKPRQPRGAGPRPAVFRAAALLRNVGTAADTDPEEWGGGGEAERTVPSRPPMQGVLQGSSESDCSRVQMLSKEMRTEVAVVVVVIMVVVALVATPKF